MSADELLEQLTTDQKYDSHKNWSWRKTALFQCPRVPQVCRSRSLRSHLSFLWHCVLVNNRLSTRCLLHNMSSKLGSVALLLKWAVDISQLYIQRKQVSSYITRIFHELVDFRW